MTPIPGVRLKALDGLSSFVRQDVRVRDAVLQSLIGDANIGVRMQALHLVEPMRHSSVRSVLARLSQSDQNASIRSQSPSHDGASTGNGLKSNCFRMIVFA